MDGAVVAAILTGLGALVTALGGVLVQLRRVAPENVAALKSRLAAAERDRNRQQRVLERTRDQLLNSNARIFRLEQVLVSKGWIDEEIDPGASAVSTS